MDYRTNAIVVSIPQPSLYQKLIRWFTCRFRKQHEFVFEKEFFDAMFGCKRALFRCWHCPASTDSCVQCFAINASEETIIKVVAFSRSPAGLTDEDGPANARKFRENHLIPALRKYPKITVVLDGTTGYASNWLEEAFGGLLYCGFSCEELLNRILLVSEDASIISEIFSYWNKVCLAQRACEW